MIEYSAVIAHLAARLSEGHGLNERLAQLDLTPEYLADKLKKADRIRLHQARGVYIEKLERSLVAKANSGRKTYEVRQVVKYLKSPEGRLELPGDGVIDLRSDPDRKEPKPKVTPAKQKKAEREITEAMFPFTNFEEYMEDVEAAYENPDIDDDPEPSRPDIPAKPTKRIRRRLSDVERPSIASIPEPEPRKTFWKRLFTGKAQEIDETTGKVIRSVMPGHRDYPTTKEIINWN